MAKEIILPKLGNSVEECLITSWKKQVGDAVQKDEVLFEVETDKTTMEVVSTETGTLLHIFFEVDEVVKILQVIAIVGEKGENIDALIKHHTSKSDSAKSTGELAGDEADANSPADFNGQAKTDIRTDTNSSDGAEYFASPRAKAYLQSKGLSFAQYIRHFPEAISRSGNKKASRSTIKNMLEEQDIKDYFDTIAISPLAISNLMKQDRVFVQQNSASAMPSGINSRVLEQDISQLPLATEYFASSRKKVVPNTDSVPPGMEALEVAAMTPLVSVRKVVAERMLASLQSTAQLTLSMQARAVNLKKARQTYKDQNRPITINDIILYVVARVLADHTEANSILIGNKVISYKQVNLGFAVQTEKGLMVPVIANANEKSIENISEEVKQLSQACKQGTISPEKLQGGTFTASNLGAWGIQVFTPILNAPQTGILGIGGIDIRAIEISDGKYDFEPCLNLSLTFDHRAYDGAGAADILKACSDAISECNLEI